MELLSFSQDRKKRTKKFKKNKQQLDKIKDAWNQFEEQEKGCQEIECVYEKNNILETNECTQCKNRVRK